MNDVNLHSFIGNCSLETLDILFPMSAKRHITALEIKDACVFEESVGHEDIVILFYQYLSQLEKYESGTYCNRITLVDLGFYTYLFSCITQFACILLGSPSTTDLCCLWTATNHLPPREGSLLVKFDTTQNKFPFAETCFLTIILPTVHQSFEMFKKYMDIALNHGSMGMHHS